ncbi:MAG: hypothetical protein WDO15_23680 [Bacteroidota bacterium]
MLPVSPYFENEPVGIVMDATGNLYVLGEFQNTIDVDPTNCVYPLASTTRSSEIFFQKIKPNLATVCFSLHPADFRGCEGAQVHLTSQAVGTTNITYQWANTEYNLRLFRERYSRSRLYRHQYI